jgi:hypothetical protein
MPNERAIRQPAARCGGTANAGLRPNVVFFISISIGEGKGKEGEEGDGSETTGRRMRGMAG